MNREEKCCVIVSGGSFSPVSDLHADFVIACDKGYTYCQRLGLRPDLIISDYDSYAGPVDPAIPVNRYASEKDDTDTMLAVRYAVEHGFGELVLCCALGGRLDHLIGNLQSLLFAQSHGVRASLLSEDTEIFTLRDGSLSVPRRPGWSLSVFALDGPAHGVCISGAKYPLQDADILPSLPLGVSNEWASDSAAVSVRDGVLMIVLSRLSEGEAH